MPPMQQPPTADLEEEFAKLISNLSLRVPVVNVSGFLLNSIGAKGKLREVPIL